MGSTETEKLCKAKDTVSKTKRLPSDWEKIFTNPSSDKGLISKIYKELKKLDTKTLINQLKNEILNWTENSQQKNFEPTIKHFDLDLYKQLKELKEELKWLLKTPP